MYSSEKISRYKKVYEKRFYFERVALIFPKRRRRIEAECACLFLFCLERSEVTKRNPDIHNLAERRVRIEAECARLESGYTARYRGFESLTLRLA